MFIDLNVRRLYLDGSLEAELLVPGRQTDATSPTTPHTPLIPRYGNAPTIPEDINGSNSVFPRTGHPHWLTDD